MVDVLDGEHSGMVFFSAQDTGDEWWVRLHSPKVLSVGFEVRDAAPEDGVLGFKRGKSVHGVGVCTTHTTHPDSPPGAPSGGGQGPDVALKWCNDIILMPSLSRYVFCPAF